MSAGAALARKGKRHKGKTPMWPGWNNAAKRSPADPNRETPTLEIDGRTVPLTLQINARARRIILKVDPVRGQVILVTPKRQSVADALAFAKRHRSWIAARLAECPGPSALAPGADVPLRGIAHRLIHTGQTRGGVLVLPENREILVSGPEAHFERRVADWLRRTAREDLNAQVTAHAQTLSVRPKKITVRDTRSRWGSCTAEGSLSFSWRLILAPPFVLDYVAAHEVAHLVHHDHSPAFWSVVRRLTDKTGEATTWLKRHGNTLHRYGRAPETAGDRQADLTAPDQA